MGFQYVVSVEEWHLSIRFYPNLQPYSVRFGGENLCVKSTNLVFGILGEVVESRYVKFEFSALAKFPKTRPEGDEIWPGY